MRRLTFYLLRSVFLHFERFERRFEPTVFFGIFDKDYALAAIGDGVGVGSNDPRFICRASDVSSAANVDTIVFMSGAQIGKTELLLNGLGFYIAHDPSPILVLQPTLEMAQAFSKDRLGMMLRDTPCLKNKVRDPRSRYSGNTTLHKSFPGGQVTIAGSNSPSGLASRPIRVVFADEVDRYPPSAGAEGDPVLLARKRSATFHNRKLVLTSTPTIPGASRIETAYDASERCRYFVPCGDCGEAHALESALEVTTRALSAALATCRARLTAMQSWLEG